MSGTKIQTVYMNYDVKNKIFFVTPYLTKSKDFLLIDEKEVCFDIPSDDLLKTKSIEALKEKKKEIQAAAHIELKEIDERIETLLCI